MSPLTAAAHVSRIITKSGARDRVPNPTDRIGNQRGPDIPVRTVLALLFWIVVIGLVTLVATRRRRTYRHEYGAFGDGGPTRSALNLSSRLTLGRPSMRCVRYRRPVVRSDTRVG